MDFVPVRFRPDPEEVSNAEKPEGADFDISKVDDVEVTEILAARTEEKTITSATAQDFSSRFLKTKVEKRPLGRMTSIDHVVETSSSVESRPEAAPTMVKETKVTHTETVRTEETMTVADAIKMAEERERAEKAKHEDKGERIWEEDIEEEVEEETNKRTGEKTNKKTDEDTNEDTDSAKDEKPEVEIEVEDEAKTSIRLKEEARKRAEKEEETKREAEAKKRPIFQRARFVNTEKIVQRPLSPVTQRPEPVIPTEEKPSAPVTIIEKPEKDSKMAVVVAIILTIILGAAAGTVAFLLLPK